MPDLFDYQKTGRDFLLTNRRCMLGDQPGLGKTAQALSALKAVPSGTKLAVCIICPRVGIENWKREIAKWGVNVDRFNLLVTNYEQLVYDTDDSATFLKTEWTVVIIDEAHRLKNPASKRSQRIYRHVFRTTYVWLLTGTPARNHAGELWTHIRALRPDLIMNAGNRPMGQTQFEDKYCRITFDIHGNRKIAGSKNMGELRNLMETSGFFLRRRKSDVRKDLPDLIFDEYALPHVTSAPIDSHPANRMRDTYARLKNMSDDEVRDFAINPPAGFPLSSAMRLLGMAKAPLVAELVEEELQAPGKIIVFHHNTDVGDVLYDRLRPFKPARVDGTTKDVMAQVDQFQDDDKCRVFVGQISACQEVLNLTAANQVIFAQASWSPADNEQAACRAHRIGMQDGLVVRFAYISGTLDEPLMRVCKRKTEELHQLFG